MIDVALICESVARRRDSSWQPLKLGFCCLGGELREAVDVRTALLALLYMSTLASLDHAFIHMNDTAAKHVTAWPNL
jgi:hypothetical protein